METIVGLSYETTNVTSDLKTSPLFWEWWSSILNTPSPIFRFPIRIICDSHTSSTYLFFASRKSPSSSPQSQRDQKTIFIGIYLSVTSTLSPVVFVLQLIKTSHCSLIVLLLPAESNSYKYLQGLFYLLRRRQRSKLNTTHLWSQSTSSRMQKRWS